MSWSLVLDVQHNLYKLFEIYRVTLVFIDLLFIEKRVNAKFCGDAILGNYHDNYAHKCGVSESVVNKILSQVPSRLFIASLSLVIWNGFMKFGEYCSVNFPSKSKCQSLSECLILGLVDNFNFLPEWSKTMTGK